MSGKRSGGFARNIFLNCSCLILLVMFSFLGSCVFMFRSCSTDSEPKKTEIKISVVFEDPNVRDWKRATPSAKLKMANHFTNRYEDTLKRARQQYSKGTNNRIDAAFLRLAIDRSIRDLPDDHKIDSVVVTILKEPSWLKSRQRPWTGPNLRELIRYFRQNGIKFERDKERDPDGLRGNWWIVKEPLSTEGRYVTYTFNEFKNHVTEKEAREQVTSYAQPLRFNAHAQITMSIGGVRNIDLVTKPGPFPDLINDPVIIKINKLFDAFRP